MDSIKFAKLIRLNTLKMLNNLGFGHYGGSLSVVEVLAVLYNDIMNIMKKIQTGRIETILYYQKVMLVLPYTAH